LPPEQAFADGTLGLELAPLKYILVASTVSKQALETDGGADWVTRFGFPSRRQPKSRGCEKDAPGNLPLGFGVIRRLPVSAAPVPIKCVGLTCAACYAAAVRGAGPILGVGSQSADVIGFGDAFLNAILDPNLSASVILDAYDKQCPGEYSGWLGTVKRRI